MKHKKIIVTVSIILAIVAIAGGGIFYKNHLRQKDTVGIPGAGGRSMLRGVGMPQSAEGMPPGAVTAGEAWVTATGTMTVLKPTRKAKKGQVIQFLEIPALFPNA